MQMQTSTDAEHDALSAAVEAAIEAEHDAELRRKRGERSSPMFDFCRILRGDEHFSDCDERQALEIVTEILTMLNPQARDVWSSEFDCDDPQASFVENWNVVAFPAGMFERAVAFAKARPIRAKQSISPKYDAFISLCAALQRIQGDRPFILALTAFAEVLNVSPRTVCTYRNLAANQGYLLQTEAAIPRQRAARFRFVADFNEGIEGTEGLEGRKVQSIR